MNLRGEVSAILNQWGHNILLQRRIDPFNGEEREYSNTLERWTVRHRYPSNASLANVQNEALQGVIHEVDMIYYFTYDAAPREGDRIYENIETFPSDQTTWLVSYSLPMRGRKGRIEYWAVGVIRETPS